MSLLPLEGFVVGVTAGRRSAEQAELLERRGASVVQAPTIATEYLGSDDALLTATEAVIAERPDYLLASTGIGVRAWFEAAHTWGLDDALLDALARTRIVARGPKATAALQVVGLPVWASPENEQLAAALELLASERLAGRVVAYQHYGHDDPRPHAVVVGGGGRLIDVPVYRYGQPADGDRAVALAVGAATGEVDAVTFTSAPAVDAFVAAARTCGWDERLRRVVAEGSLVVACIGAVGAAAAERAGLSPVVAPERGRLGLMVRALGDALADRRRTVRVGALEVVVQGRAVEIDGETVRLPARERTVLDALLQRPGAVVGKSAILRLWGTGPEAGHALETTVARLRSHLGPVGPAVLAVRGRGYRIDAEAV